jgi:hypothetical protein
MGAMAEAKLNRDYAFRFLGVGALMVGMCVWSLVDGLSAWPQKNRDLERVRPDLLATNLTAEAWCKRGARGMTPLDAAFQARGVPAPAKLVTKLGALKLPEASGSNAEMLDAQAQRVRQLFAEPVYSDHNLRGQFVQAAITLTLGLLALGSVGMKARRRYVADDTGLSGSGLRGGGFAYADIAQIDWSRWDQKGIVTIRLNSGRKHKLDGWHFAGITGIVDEIKRQRPDLAG